LQNAKYQCKCIAGAFQTCGSNSSQISGDETQTKSLLTFSIRLIKKIASNIAQRKVHHNISLQQNNCLLTAADCTWPLPISDIGGDEAFSILKIIFKFKYKISIF